MKVNITLTLDVGDDPYEDACAYMRYQYDEVPSDLLVDPTEAAFDEVALNAIEAVIVDIMDSELDDACPCLQGGWTRVHATIEAAE